MTEPESTWSQCSYKYPDSLLLLLVKLDEQTEKETEWKLLRSMSQISGGDYVKSKIWSFLPICHHFPLNGNVSHL